METARGEHERVGDVGRRRAGGGRVDRNDPIAVARVRDDTGAEREAAARALEGVAQDLEQPHPRNRRRQRGNLEDTSAEPRLEVREHGMWVAQAEHRRQRDLLGGAEQRRQPGAEPGAPAVVVEVARERECAGVGALELDVDADRERVDPGGVQVGRAQLRVEVAQRRHADDGDPAERSRVARGERLRHRGRGLERAHGGGQQQVALEAAGVGVTRQRSSSGGREKPVQGLGDELVAEQRVGVIGARGHERRQRTRRRLDTLGRVSEDVDRAGRQVRRTDALGHHAHARAGLRQAGRGDQAGGAGTDHDRVVAPLAPHAAASATAPVPGSAPDTCPAASGPPGRWSTSSTPWKIHSSKRIWRCWSP